MADVAKIADHNCAAKLMAALLEDGNGKIVTQDEADAGAQDPGDNVYICIDMGETGVVCIVRPRQQRPVRVRM